MTSLLCGIAGSRVAVASLHSRAAQREFRKQGAHLVYQCRVGIAGAVGDCQTVINATGALGYAREAARREANAAKAAIQCLPDSAAKATLIGLADYAVVREN